MKVIEVIQKRYSCRAYQDKPIEQDKLDQIFEAARQAPSAKNLQDWRFVVVTDKQVKQRVAGGRFTQDRQIEPHQIVAKNKCGLYSQFD